MSFSQRNCVNIVQDSGRDVNAPLPSHISKRLLGDADSSKRGAKLVPSSMSTLSEACAMTARLSPLTYFKKSDFYGALFSTLFLLELIVRLHWEAKKTCLK